MGTIRKIVADGDFLFKMSIFNAILQLVSLTTVEKKEKKNSQSASLWRTATFYTVAYLNWLIESNFSWFLITPRGRGPKTAYRDSFFYRQYVIKEWPENASNCKRKLLAKEKCENRREDDLILYSPFFRNTSLAVNAVNDQLLHLLHLLHLHLFAKVTTIF